MSNMVAFNTAYKQATDAYNNIGNVANPTKNSDTGFGSFVGEALGNLSNALQGAENISSKALVNQADITDVVTSVSEAQLKLEAVMKLRDQGIAAYQDILKMPI